MNGAESLVRTLGDSGIEVCFANPGTSELHFVAALESAPKMRAILGLFEGAVTGMADGYGRMAKKPAVALLHLGPGFANGIANLHNARRAATPLVAIVGDHATYHLRHDAPLTADIEALAGTVSAWVHASSSAKSVAADGARAVAAARAAPGGVATLILPANTAWDEEGVPVSPLPVTAPRNVPTSVIDATAAALGSGRKTAILLRGTSLERGPLVAAGRIAAKSGARLLCDTFSPRLARGAGIVRVERIPYLVEQILEFLEGTEQLVLVGAVPPVSFFAYPGKPGWCTPRDAEILTLARPDEDGPLALEALADAIHAPRAPGRFADYVKADMPAAGTLDSFTMGQIIARFLPENAILSDEAATSGAGTALFAASAHAHEVLSLTGGAIGQAIPVAAGASVACPERKVVALQGDGGAMYYLQALWTQAREKLDITNVICANKSYAILNVEMARFGTLNAGPKALSMLDLHDPELDWVSLARGMGMEGTRARTTQEFADQFEDAMKTRGPCLIEAVLE